MMRSVTAENLYKDCQGIEVKSAGISTGALVRIDDQMMEWADIIFVMENTQKEFLIKNFKTYSPEKKIINLNIPDDYNYMDPDLIDILKTRVDNYLLPLIN